MRRGRLRTVAAVLAASHVAACTRWEPATVAPPQALEERRGEECASPRTTSPRSLWEYVLQGDSIYGNESRSRRTCRTRLDTCEVAMPLSDIRYVDVRRFDAGRTMLVPGAIAVGVLLAVLVQVACNGDDSCLPE